MTALATYISSFLRSTSVGKMAAFIREYGLTDIVTWAVPPGLRPDQMNRHLERYATELVPQLKAMFPG